MTIPPKKRQRLDEESGDADTDAMQVDDHTLDASQAKETLHSTISSLTDQVKSLDSSDPDAVMNISLQFLKLKRLQRQLLEQGAKTETILQQQAQEGKKQLLRKQNLQYQQQLNEASVKGSASGNISSTTSSNLYKLAASASATMDVEDADPSKTIEEYLNIEGGDWNDPTQRQAILSTLNREMTTRLALQQQLEEEEKKLKDKHASLQKQQKQLKDMPKQIAAMERASQPLQQFFQNNMPGTSTKTGTKRLERIEHAKQLPKALYTLFYQLQTTLDFLAIQDDDGIVKESLPQMSLVAAGGFSQSKPPQVVLTFAIPTIADDGSVTYHPKNSHKAVTATFQYDATKDVITALCKSKDGSDIDATLIGELFPGDTGDELVGSKIGFGANSNNAKAYQWCNYLGGLFICASETQATDKPHAPTPTMMQASSKAIVKAIIRRVRASATLSHLLGALFRNQMVVHPAVKEKLDYDKFPATVKLASWTLLPNQDDGDKLCRVYEAVLKDTKSSTTLKTRVRINMARYPSMPPVWDLTGWSSRTAEKTPLLDDIPLYNEEWDNLEKSINHNIGDLVVDTDETTYEWILAHQLWELARRWGEKQVESVEPS